MVFPYKLRTAGIFGDSLRLGGRARGSRFHAITINAFDRSSQVVGIEVGVALRGREVGVAGQLLAPIRRRASSRGTTNPVALPASQPA